MNIWRPHPLTTYAERGILVAGLEAGAGGAFEEGDGGFGDASAGEIGALSADFLEQTRDLIGGTGRGFKGPGEGWPELIHVDVIEDHDALGGGGSGLENGFDSGGVGLEFKVADPGNGPGLVTGEAVGEDTGGLDRAPNGGVVLESLEDGSGWIVTARDEEIEVRGEPRFAVCVGEEWEPGLVIWATVVGAVALVIAVP